MLSEHGLLLQEHIGRGASGRVYRATDIRTGNRQVAVKLFDSLGDYGPESLARELDTAANLRHDNIITIHRANTATEPRFLVLELADKEPRHLPLGVKDTVDCGVRLCSALALAHESGIVHSDIKPHNILWRDGRRPLLSDFGSAKIDAVTRYRSGIGYQPEWSPSWMTDPAMANEASDLWSLAASIGWLRWQQRPHEMDWTNAEPRELGAILADVLADSGAHEPPAGLTSGGPLELGRRLQQYQYDQGWPVTPFPPPHDDQTWATRTVTSSLSKPGADGPTESLIQALPGDDSPLPIRRVVTMGTVLALVLLGVGWLLRDIVLSDPATVDGDAGSQTANESNANDTSSDVTVPTDPADGEPDIGGDSGTSEPDPGPTVTGSELFVFASDRAGDLDLFVRDAQGEISILLDRPEDDYNPSLSPDGKQVVFESTGDGTRSVYVAPADGSGEPRRLSGEGIEAIEPDWSPDGDRIVWVSRERSNWDIALYRRDEGTTTLLTTSSSDERNPAWSADGSMLAFRSDRTGSGDIYILDVDSGAVRRLTDSPFREDNPAWLDSNEIAYEVALDGDLEVFSKPVNVGTSGEHVRRTDRLGFDGSPAYLGGRLVLVQVDGDTSSIVLDPGGDSETLDSSFGTIQGLEIGPGSSSAGASK